MKPLARIAVQEHDGVSVVNHGMIIDLSEVTYLNSGVVKFLFDLSERLRQGRQQLRLVIAEAAPTRTLFQALKFDLVVPLHASIEDALQSHATTKP